VRFGSVCSGIEAASVAWHPLGWRASFLSEIEPFPRAVLAHHYPDVPLHGDFTTIEHGQYESIDLLVGGTPCQDFSVAGKRAGLDGQRGNLTLEYARLARRLGARWLVWENVPGVFSNNDGRDFGAVLACFAGYPDGYIFPPPADGWRNAGIVPPAGPHGHGLAWRVLDAQHFGVPQRRRRVFVVGYLGDWRPAAAVLLELHSLQGHPAPRREAGKGSAVGTLRRTDGGSDVDHGLAGHLITGPLQAGGEKSAGSATQQDAESGLLVAFGGGKNCNETDIATAVTAHPGGYRMDLDSETFVAHTLKGEGFDASEDGTGRGTPLVPVAFAIQERAVCENPDAGPDGAGFRSDNMAYTLEARTVPQAVAFTAQDHGGDALEDCAPTLRAGGHAGSHANAGVMPAVAYGLRGDAGRSGEAKTPSADAEGRVRLRDAGFNAYEETAPTLDASQPHSVGTASAVRRLTPRECERLQGFLDDYTLIPYGRPSKAKLDADFLKYQLRGNPKHLTREDVERLAADGPRYKALGNSMAVPVMAWVGKRIQQVELISADYGPLQVQHRRAA